jgi:hypothetical protein
VDLKTIVITWMDGPAASYENATTNVLNGVLHVYLYKVTGSGAKIMNQEWHFPISNIRAWGPAEWGGDHGILLHAENLREPGRAPGS